MELESKSEGFTVTLSRAGAIAFADVADLGLRMIEQLGSVKRPEATERALVGFRGQVAAARGRAVDVTLNRVEATLIERAGEMGLKVKRALREALPDGAAETLAELKAAR